MTNLSEKICNFLKTRQSHCKKNAVTHYIKLLEQKDHRASIELEKLEASLNQLHHAYQEVETQVRKFRKCQNARAEVAKHLSTHNHFM
ncbi:hypothetical protein [Vibrio mediterranei]|uniref:Uncharacterized protein n=1 Tax=Vibrio mediterranei TaxID=689 RepID=A0A3G4V8L2_9VIBR|nr:hypothetical protein [Vibrio mediterranei]AYV21133.1 hypothetical protein ECB94_07410 [Vibrio mediterranei]